MDARKGQPLMDASNSDFHTYTIVSHKNNTNVVTTKILKQPKKKTGH
jgi:hypothetical protein